MPTSLVVDGLAQAAQKKRLLARAPAQRLADYATSKGITDLDGLRAWLTAGEGLSGDLAKKLLAVLPPVGGRSFGPYRALAHLADGGMGSVWLAERPGEPGLVVVKTVKSDLPIEPNGTQANEFVRRFERETKVTKQLTHPNVVRCLDSGIADRTTLFMVLEYVDSGDLRDLVDLKGGLSEPLALAILYQVADGLAEAHRLKLVHRDIKPPNIFVSSEGRAKLADFGIARSTDTGRTALTMEGAIVGSPQYMSPEQVLTDPTLDIRSDIYAVGCVLYFCLAAEPPYHGRLQEMLHQHCTAPVPDVRKKRAKISDATQAIIATAMAKDRSKRYPDPAAMRTAIGEAMAALGHTTHHEETTQLRGPSSGATSGISRDIATLTADLRRQAGLDDMSTIAVDGRGIPKPGADQGTVAMDLSAGADQVTLTLDLSRGADPAAATIPTGGDQPTMAANLNADWSGAAVTVPSTPSPAGGATADMPTIAADLNAMATMTAMLMREDVGLADPPPPTKRDPGTSATIRASAEEMGTIARILAGKDAPAAKGPTGSLDGDLASALAAEWLTLLPAGAPGDQAAVMLWAKPTLLIGKLREAPVDLCARNYPVAIHKEACQRISRSHAVLRYDALNDRCLLEDQNAPNGTMLDGIAVPAGGSATLAPGVDNILQLAGVVVLWLRLLPRRGPTVAVLAGATGATAGSCGIDSANGYDAVIITRPENRPEMAYAQVLRRLTVGGPGADLVLAGARTRAAVELARFGNRWIHRPAQAPGQPEAPWKPLTDGETLDLGGRQFTAGPGIHTQF